MEEVEMIKRKWKNLRDTFVKSLKKGSEKPWKHMEAMSFLLPFLQIKTIGGWKDSALSLSGPSSSSLEENPVVPEVQVKSEDEDSSQYWRNISFLTRNVEVVLGASEGRDSAPSRKRAREEPFNPSGRYSEALSPAFAHNFGQNINKVALGEMHVGRRKRVGGGRSGEWPRGAPTELAPARLPGKCERRAGETEPATVCSILSDMVDIGTLIECVHGRPCLWDQYSKEYYNREHIARNWKEIAEILGVRYELAKSKWKHLRDNYRAELKKTLKSLEEDDENSRYQTSWVWFEALHFLRDFVFSKGNNRSNRLPSVGPPEDLSCSTSNQSAVSIKVEPDVDLDGDEPSGSSDQSGPVFRAAKVSGYRKRRMAVCEADTEESGKKERTEAQDDNYHFVMSILPSLRNLPIQSQMLIKSRIHELIYQEYVKTQADISS